MRIIIENGQFVQEEDWGIRGGFTIDKGRFQSLGRFKVLVDGYVYADNVYSVDVKERMLILRYDTGKVEYVMLEGKRIVIVDYEE